MAQTRQRPKRKNPLAAHPAADAAAGRAQPRRARAHRRRGARRLELQVCHDCGAVQYPPREVCRDCLSRAARLAAAGRRAANCSRDTVLHAAQELLFSRAPAVAHRHGPARCRRQRDRVCARERRRGARPSARRGRARPRRPGGAGRGRRTKGEPHLSDDPKLREMTCDPRSRKMLVTDGKSPVGQAVVRALAAAGADLIWVGEAEPWKKIAGFAALRRLPQVTSCRSTSPTAARCASLPARSAARSISSSTPPNAIAPSASARAAASRRRSWKWT